MKPSIYRYYRNHPDLKFWYCLGIDFIQKEGACGYLRQILICSVAPRSAYRWLLKLQEAPERCAPEHLGAHICCSRVLQRDTPACRVPLVDLARYCKRREPRRQRPRKRRAKLAAPGASGVKCVSRNRVSPRRRRAFGSRSREARLKSHGGEKNSNRLCDKLGHIGSKTSVRNVRAEGATG